MTERVTLSVPLGARSYPVVVDPDGFDGLQEVLLDRAPGAASGVVVVTDDHVGPLWSSTLAAALPDLAITQIRVRPGEAHKTLSAWGVVIDQILASGADRQTPVLALGGGVVGDLAGFAAACALRGMPVVQLPTSLLAMVDASVGGKTAVDHPLGRNLVGAFHQPVLVWVALRTLSTLPDQEWTSGLGEVVKTAMVGDGKLLAALETPPVDPQEAVVRCVGVKARIVASDERDGAGRMVLNAGHTVGHALETALGHGCIPHGHAVAIGLVVEARYATRTGICREAGLVDRLVGILHGLGLPTSVPPGVSEDHFLRALRVDKKGVADRLTVPLPVATGVYTMARVPWPEASDLWKSRSP